MKNIILKHFIIIFILTSYVSFSQQAYNSLQKLDTNELLNVIVTFNEKPIVEQARTLGKKSGSQSIFNSLVSQHQEFISEVKTRAIQINTSNVSQIEVYKEFFMSVNGVAMKIPRYLFNEISKIPNVKSVFLDEVVPLESTITNEYQLNSNPKATVTDSVYTGKGIRIAIFDTGINFGHPALGGGVGPNFKIIFAKDFVNNQSNPVDYLGHGTHVAGIAAGKSNSFNGVAPDADLLDIKTYDDNLGGSPWSAIIAGIEYCLDPNADKSTEDQVEILNMSFGGGTIGSENPFNESFRNAVLSGITIVASAGNSGPDYNTVVDPSRFNDVISVGNWDSQGNTINSSSSRGPALPSLRIKPDVSAPGTNILSCDLGSGYVYHTGTSMAAPYVAGVAALLKEKNKSLNPKTICSIISQSSDDMKIDSWAQGFGLVNINKALSRTTAIYPTSFGTTVEGDSKVLFDTLKITNLSNQSKFYNVSISGLLPSGINLSLSTTGFNLDFGKTISIIVRSEYNPSSIPLLSNNKSNTYSASINFISNSDTTEVKYFCYRGTMLRVNTPSGWPVISVQNSTTKYLAESFYNVDRQSYKVDYIYPQNIGDYDILGSVQGINYRSMPAPYYYEDDTGYFIFPKVHLEGYKEITLDSSIYKYKIENNVFNSLGNKIQFLSGWDVIGDVNTEFGIFGTNYGKDYYFTEFPQGFFQEYQLFTKDYDLREFIFVNNYMESIDKSSTLVFDKNTMKKIDINYNLPPSLSNVWSVTKTRANFYDLGPWVYIQSDWVRHPILEKPFNETVYFAPIKDKKEGQSLLCGKNQPYLKNILYNKTSDRFNGNHLIINEKPLLESGYYVQQDPDTLVFLEDKTLTYSEGDYNALFKITSSKIDYLLGPPHFYGKITFQNNQLIINYLNNNEKDGFKEIFDQFYHYQFHDVSNYQNIYAYIKVNSLVIDSMLISNSNAKLSSDIMFSKTLTGQIDIEIPFYDYEINHVNGAAKVNFSFNTSAVDKNPPYIPFLQIYDGPQIVNKVNSTQNVLLKFQAYDNVGLKEIKAFYMDINNIWSELKVDNPHQNNYAASFLGTPNEGFISFKFIATDNSDNTCEYVCEPGLYYVTKLTTATLSSPTNNATGISLSPILNWLAVPGAEKYRVEVNTKSDFTGIKIYEQDSVTSVSKQIGGLNDNTIYYWRVTALNNAGNSSDASNTFSFTTEQSVLSAATNGAVGITTSPKLSWNKTTGANTYRLEVNKKSDFTGTIVFDNSSLTDTMQSLNGLANNTTYYWRVTARSNNLPKTNSSYVYSFTTKLSKPLLISPLNNASNVSITPDLSWTIVSGSDKYKVEVNSKNDFSGSVIFDMDTVKNTVLTLSGLSNDSTYYWRITALNNLGNFSDTSSTYMFTTTTSTGIDAVKGIPNNFEVYQNYPNPFNPSTIIRYALPTESKIEISVYNVLGQKIKELLNTTEAAGYYEIIFDAAYIPSGIYFYQIKAGNFIDTKKMILLR